MGSGVEMILTLLLLKSIAGESKGSIIYLIDEPELHLHPKAQDKLLDLLIRESKNKQIILSSQSPYIFKNCLNHPSNIIILKRDISNKILIDYPNIRSWGKFPWSPSWGEINYFAYDLATVDYHNELYGYIQETTSKHSSDLMDLYLESRGLTKTKQWIKISNGKPLPPIHVTLPTFVRHSIHHPENSLNPKITPIELSDSIRMLRSIV